MRIKATNNFVFILRDETEETSNGFSYQIRVGKAKHGKDNVCGRKVQDPDIQRKR